jgi:hypothetical protein
LGDLVKLVGFRRAADDAAPDGKKASTLATDRLPLTGIAVDIIVGG